MERHLISYHIPADFLGKGQNQDALSHSLSRRPTLLSVTLYPTGPPKIQTLAYGRLGAREESILKTGLQKKGLKGRTSRCDIGSLPLFLSLT